MNRKGLGGTRLPVTVKLVLPAFWLVAQLLCSSSGMGENLSFEVPPTRKAKDVLPQSVLKGPHHFVDSRVGNDGLMNLYVLHTRFGNQEVRGTRSLMKRISEVDALDYLDKNYPSGTVAFEAVLSASTDLATAPIRGITKLYETASERDGVRRTLESVPGGVVNLISFAADTVGEVAGFAYDSARLIVSADEAGGGLRRGGEFVEDQALEYSGYGRAFRELAKTLRVDPYTDNPLLRSELRRVSAIRATVRLGSRFVPAPWSIPGINTTNRYFGYAAQFAAYEDPRKVEQLNRRMLEALGRGGTKASVAAVLKSEAYSPPMRRELALNLESLKNVAHFEALIVLASKAKSRGEAEFYLAAIRKLGTLHRGGTHFSKVVPDPEIPAALTKEGVLIVALPADTLVWTEHVAKALSGVSKGTTTQAAKASVRLLVAGTVSPRSKEELKALAQTDIKERVVF